MAGDKNTNPTDKRYKFSFLKNAKKDTTEEENVAEQPKSVSLFTLFRYASGWDYVLIFFGLLVSLITGTGWPLLSVVVGGISDTFIKGQRLFSGDGSPNDTFNFTLEQFIDESNKFCLYHIYLGFIAMAAAFVQVACWLTSCERQIFKLRNAFFTAMLRQDITYFDQTKNTGTTTSKLFDSIERVKEGIGDKLGLFVQSITQFFAGIAIAFYFSWKLTLVMMSLTPFIAIIGAFLAKLMETSAKQEQELYAKAGAIAAEVISSIRTVLAFNGQETECKRYETALAAGKRKGILKSFYIGAGLFCTFVILYGNYGLAFWVGSLMLNNDELTPQTILTVFFAVMLGSLSLGMAGPQAAVVTTAMGSAASIFHVIDREPEIDSYSQEGGKIENPIGRVSLEGVTFNYPNRKEITVLDNVSFTAEPGKTVALVGSSGSGKSTVVRLLLRYYDPNNGKLCIDGEDIRTLNIKWLRNMIGVVSQEPILFDATIEQNIRYGNDNISDEEMTAACKMANAHDFISGLPAAYKTSVGERGTQLSGGQKQRIAIARALVRKPKILLLDEATSALDAESEGVVQEALDKARKGRTTIVIAHRLSTIRNADKIIAMQNGEICEIGSHDELMKRKTVYYNLVNAQTMQDSIDTGVINLNQVVVNGDLENGQIVDDNGEESFETARSRSSLLIVKQLSRQLSNGSNTAIDVIARRRTSSILVTPQLSAAPTKEEKENERKRLEKELVEEGAQKSNLIQIAKAARPEWWLLGLGVLVYLVEGTAMPLFSVLYSNMMETFTKRGDALLSEAAVWSWLFVLLGFIDGTTILLGNIFFGTAGERMTMRLRGKTFRNVLSQDIAYFDDSVHSTGRICTRLSTDASNLKNAVDYRLGVLVSSFISVFVGLCLAFVFGWKMALLLVAIFPLAGVGDYFQSKFAEGRHREETRLLEEAGKTAQEAIEHVRTVQALARERRFCARFRDQLRTPHANALRKAWIQAVCYAFAASIYFFLYGIAFRFGAYLVQTEQMTPLAVFRVLFAISFTAGSIGWAAAYFPEYMKATFSAGLIFKMLSIRPKIDNFSTEGRTPALSGKISLESVEFVYPTRNETPVLRGLSLHLNPGETLALVGASGCGKSTVVSLLERFYDPIQGLVCIDGFDLKELNVRHARRHISLVSQEPILFDCSIRDNIRYGMASVEEQDIFDACKLANIHDFITTLPKGYETHVGEKGTQLSGGQKQRIAIARALVRKPKILLLDEATSALDTESEKLVQEALDKARQGRTCIIIAHRLSTVQSADSIAVIKRGVVVEQGSHAELVDSKGDYYNLTRKQNMDS